MILPIGLDFQTKEDSAIDYSLHIEGRNIKYEYVYVP